jgi:hypothetical protein
MYKDYIRTLNGRVEAELSRIASVHNLELGDEFEIALCEVLRAVFPDRFGVCRGYVVDAHDNSAGDDIIIFDRQRFPILRIQARDDFSRKEWVPIEAVYAYIEAKHTLDLVGTDRSSLAHAVVQASRVKQLCNTRQSVRPGVIRPFFDLGQVEVFQIQTPHGYPSILNPCYTVIISRYVREKSRGPILKDATLIQGLLLQQNIPDDSSPDLVIAGQHNLLIPVLEPTEETPYARMISPFYVPAMKRLYSASVDGVAFGVGLCQLMSALDWIQLGIINWADIVGEIFESR